MIVDSIIIKGARQNNLKNIDVVIPRISPPLPPPPEISGPILAIIGLAGSVIVVGATTNIGNRMKKRRSKKGKEPEQKRSAHEIIEDVEKVSFDNWD